MNAYECFFAKNSRRDFFISIAGLLGSGGLLGSQLQRFLTKSDSEGGILVRVSFHSKRFPEKKYQNLEDFWADHPALSATSYSSLNALKDVEGKRLKAQIVETGNPVYEVYYPSLTAYLNHSYYLKQAHDVQCEQVSESCFKFISPDFFAVDEIKKIS